MASPEDLDLAIPETAQPLDPATRTRARAVTQAIDKVQRDVQRVTQLSREEIEEVAEKYARARRRAFLRRSWQEGLAGWEG